MFKPFHKFPHAIKLQRRTKITGVHISLSNQAYDGLLLKCAVFQIFFKGSFLAHCQFFMESLPLLVKSDAGTVQMLLQFAKKFFAVRSFLVHLIDKYKNRYPVSS